MCTSTQNKDEGQKAVLDNQPVVLSTIKGILKQKRTSIISLCARAVAAKPGGTFTNICR